MCLAIAFAKHQQRSFWSMYPIASLIFFESNEWPSNSGQTFVGSSTPTISCTYSSVTSPEVYPRVIVPSKVGTSTSTPNFAVVQGSELTLEV